MSIMHRSIGRRVIGAIAVLLIAVATIGAWNLALMVRSNAISMNLQTLQVALEQVMTTRFALARQENSMRGFMITQDPYFSDRVGTHLAAFNAAVETLEEIVSGQDAKERIDIIRDGIVIWHRDIVQPVLRFAANEATFQDARALMVSGRADELIAPVEDALDSIRDEHRAAIEVLLSEDEAIARRFMQVMVVGFVVALGLAVLVGWGLVRSIARPVAAMTKSMQAQSDGDLDVRVVSADRPDEIGRMAAALEVLREASRERVRLQAEVEARSRETQAMADCVRKDAEAAALVFSQALSRVRSGDLTAEIVDHVPEGYMSIKRDLNVGLAQICAAILAAKEGTAGIRAMSGEIASAADDLARRTESQAASLEETAAAVEEITSTIKSAADGAGHARDMASQMRRNAEQAGRVVQETVSAMSVIDRSTSEIGQISSVIDEIAFQTNLLALNAAVEAARAGEAGRGFALVATEVRALAQRSANSARQIKELVNTSVGNVTHGVELVSKTAKSLMLIVDDIAQVDNLVRGIAVGAAEQSAGLAQVNVAVSQMDHITQQNAALVEESTSAARDLANRIEKVADHLDHFRTGDVQGALSEELKSNRAGHRMSLAG